MKYVEIYKITIDLSQGLLNDKVPLFVSITALGLLVLFLLIYKNKLIRPNTKKISIFPILGIMLISIVFFYIYYLENERKSQLLAVLEENKFRTVEGLITNFNNVRANMYIESFTVNGVNFEYHQHENKQGYSIPLEEGGILRPGMNVRIDYFEDEILRIYEILNFQSEAN